MKFFSCTQIKTKQKLNILLFKINLKNYFNQVLINLKILPINLKGWKDL